MKTTTIETPPGGVMTREAGAVTGELELMTEQTPKGLEVTARYVGAEDVWRLAGSPFTDLSHDDLVTRLTEDPGTDEAGNAAVVDLSC
ncbi:hypothetical protein [Arsenicicoccus dermatophilus]|uniref:hypothetical protein n=1 Tax=Arsenicicoccus dermatophilus TaxID=1076331 RepID=UPI0039175600